MQRQGNKTDGDQAAANYFEFLTRGRRILLEDTAILQDAYSEHRLFNLPCFKLPAEEHARTVLQQKWADYKAEVIAAHGRSLADNLQVKLQPGCMSMSSKATDWLCLPG